MGIMKKEYTRELAGFPEEIVEVMMHNQELQHQSRNHRVFERYIYSCASSEGFDWDRSPEGHEFWQQVAGNRDFELFFKKFPKNTHEYELWD